MNLHLGKNYTIKRPSLGKCIAINWNTLMILWIAEGYIKNIGSKYRNWWGG